MSDVAHINHPQIPLAGLLEAAREAMLAEFEAKLAETGYGDIRPTHGCVFRFVREDGMRLTDLAQMAGMTKQSVGEIVDGLVVLGYVERIPDPSDQRAKLICLTARGQQAQATGFSLFRSMERRWAKQFGPERMAVLRELLEDILAEKAPHAVPELAHEKLAGARSA